MGAALLPIAHLTIAADPMSVRRGLQCLFSVAPLLCLTDDSRGTAEIVMAEALNNIVEHAYAGGAGDIEISVELDGNDLACHFADTGAPMPDNQLPIGAAHNLENDLPEGGFGWFLIRSLTQDLHYFRHQNQNNLRFRMLADRLDCQTPLGRAAT